MDRRRFEHLFAELSVSCRQVVPRYRLWLALREDGADPELLCLDDAVRFCDIGLEPFLAHNGLSLSRWRRRRLRRSILAFDPERESASAFPSQTDPMDGADF